LDEYNQVASSEFEEVTSLDSAVKQSSFKAFYETVLDRTSRVLQNIADTQDDVRNQFNAINDSINTGIDILVDEPLTLAFQTILLIQSPARAISNIQARLDAYSNLTDSIILGDSSISQPTNESNTSNEFHTNDLYVSTYLTGGILSVVNTEFVTRNDAVSAAEFILNQFDAVINWRDDNFTSLGEIDTGGAYQQLANAVAITAGFLVEISFNLKQEKSIILDRARTVIDLAAELYGEVDSQLDFLINSNNLTGSEILELSKGRRIVYYI
jgi:hypothetical protein